MGPKNRAKGRNRFFNKEPRQPLSAPPVAALVVPVSTPPEIISKILKVTDLTYDKSVGTLSGDNVFVSGLSGLKTQMLQDLKGLAKQLKKSLEQITEEDSFSILRAKKEMSERFGESTFTREDIEFLEAHERRLEDFGITAEARGVLMAPVVPEVVVKPEGSNETGDEVEEPSRKKIKLEEPWASSGGNQDFDSGLFVRTATERLKMFVAEEGRTDMEYLKKWYGVSSFPSDYLASYLSGDIPTIDFNQQKEVKNKTNFNNFVGFLDNYFRPYEDEDLVFLKKKNVYSASLDGFYANQFNNSRRQNRLGALKERSVTSYNPKVHPFIVPKLGKLYTKVWAEEDGTTSKKMSSPLPQEFLNLEIKDRLIPKGSPDSITDGVLETDGVSCGPLVSRLLSALIKNDDGSANLEVKEEETESEKKPDDESNIYGFDSGSRAPGARFDYSSIEERLKRELKYVGVYVNYNNESQIDKSKGFEGESEENVLSENFEQAWIVNKQDDEICKELRCLQKQLKVVNLKNNLRKRLLFKKVYEEISFREFYNILENLNKQIDQYYLKKKKILVRHHKKKKPGTPGGSAEVGTEGMGGSLSHQQVIDKTLKSLIEKRAKWIEKIGPLFDYTLNIQLRNYPEENLFDGKIAEINEDNFEEYYDVYSEFYDSDEGNNRITLTEGVKIDKDELKLDGHETEFDKRFDKVR